jgi:hypothetical protein
LEKFRGVLQNYGVLGFFRIFRIILLKKIRRIGLQPHGPSHESTGLIKRLSLATGSTVQIKPSEPIFLDLISTAYLGVDG